MKSNYKQRLKEYLRSLDADIKYEKQSIRFSQNRIKMAEAEKKFLVEQLDKS